MAKIFCLLPGLQNTGAMLNEGDIRRLCPSLNKLVTRAWQRDCLQQRFTERLFTHFGFERPREADFPEAAVAYLGETGQKNTAWWLRIDPVYLQADLQDSLLHDQRALMLSETEADDLLAALRVTFPEFAFYRTTAAHWYLSAEQDYRLSTTSLSEVSGGYAGRFLPQGKDARFWLKFLTEVQMLLFDHPLNRQRENRGELPVNSIWLYGAGRLPEFFTRPYAAVAGGACLGRGLALLSEVRAFDLSAGYTAAAAELYADMMLVIEQPLSTDQELHQYERFWFAPMLEDLQRGRLKSITLDFCGSYYYEITRKDLRRFWRIAKSFAERLA